MPDISSAAVDAATPEEIARLCGLFQEQGKPVPLQLEEASLRIHLQGQPQRIEWLQRLCTVLEMQGKPVPLDIEETSLQIHLQSEPDRIDLMQRLCAVLAMQGKPIPLQIEEASLRIHLRSQPDRIEWLQRLCTVLDMQGKPVPLDLEEATLCIHLQNQPDRIDLLQRLCAVLEAQGKAVPLPLEERTLLGHLAAEPHREDLLARLAFVLARQRKAFPAHLQEQSIREGAIAHHRADLRKRLKVWESGMGHAEAAKKNRSQRAFLIVANMRCGTTWTQMMFAELGDVATDYEFKWAPAYPAKSEHMVIPNGTFSCRRALQALSENAAIVGSKLIFDPVRLTRQDSEALAMTIERDIDIIHLVRDYFDIANSYYRGVFHLLNRPDEPTRSLLHGSLKDSTRAFEAYASAAYRGRKRFVPPREAARLFRIFLQNDLWAAKLRWCNRYERVSFGHIARAFPDLAQFVGSTAGKTTAERIVASPPTIQLPHESVIANRLQILLLAVAFNVARELGLFAIFVAGIFKTSLRPQTRCE